MTAPDPPPADPPLDGARPRVVVCGLGPGGPDLVTPVVTAAIDRVPHRFLRTTRHPSAPIVGGARSFDDLYEAADRIEDVYAGIVEALITAAAEHGEVLYAVPGSPVVAEHTVELLVADARVDVELLPALSFVDLAWVRLGVDPVERGVRLVDGHRFARAAAGERGPLLVGQCDTPDVLAEIKLAVGEVVDAIAAAHPGNVGPGRAGNLGPDTSPADPGGSADADADADADGAPADEAPTTPLVPTVTVLQRLGLPDERIVEIPWHDLDRAVEPDHLTSVYVPVLAAPIAAEVGAFAEVVRRLRAECPWDREQTHESLRRHLLEEAYEVLEAIDHLDVEEGEGFDDLEEELGDLLFQVVFHAALAAEEGRFTLADVARGISTKLIGRHPHVFGDATAADADEVAARWEQLKKAEKGRASVMDGIPVALPALLFASKVQRKAESQGVDWRDLVDERHGDGAHGADGAPTAAGRRLLEVVDEVRLTGEDPETELRLAAEQVRDAFRAQEPASGVSHGATPR